MRIVVSGYHGMGNTGDEAVLEAFLQGVRKVLPQARLTVLSGDPESTERAYGVDSVSRTHLPSIVRALRDADLLVSGGGSLLQDVTGPFTVPYYTGIMLLAYLMRVPVAVYAQGLG
ncbi:MAG: polysaccharide pyruvyl transferase family protein, partial [Bacillota bacterium]